MIKHKKKAAAANKALQISNWGNPINSRLDRDNFLIAGDLELLRTPLPLIGASVPRIKNSKREWESQKETEQEANLVPLAAGSQFKP